MPLNIQEALVKGRFLYIWLVTEDLDALQSMISLTDMDKEKLEKFTNITRKKELLAARLLLKEAFDKEVEIIYNENNKPSVQGENLEISISHAGKYVALTINKRGTTGVDIEVIKPKINSIKHKFLSEAELEFTSDSIDSLYVCWCAKEALYKLYGKKLLSFKENINIQSFTFNNQGEIKGSISTNDFYTEYSLFYKKMNDYMLVYVFE